MFELKFDLSDLMDLGEMQSKCEDLSAKYSKELAEATYGKVVEIAEKKLNTRKERFLKGLSMDNPGKAEWSVVLDEKVVWIDDGLSPYDQKEALLKTGAKTSASGSRYKVIGFEHKGGTPAQSSLTQTIQAELGRRKATGQNIDKFNIMDAPMSTSALKIGAGPKGQVAQGAASGIPLLKGVNMIRNSSNIKTRQLNEKAVTFRTVSDNSPGDSWKHPGLEKTGIFDEATEWAEKEAETYLEKIIKAI